MKNIKNVAVAAYYLVGCSFMLDACTGLNLQSIHYDTGEAYKTALNTADLAVKAADQAVVAGLVSPAGKTTIVTLTKACPEGQMITTFAQAQALCPIEGTRQLATQAYNATNATSLAQLIAQLIAYVGQLNETHQ